MSAAMSVLVFAVCSVGLGTARSVPLVGFGNEWVFNAANDTELTELVRNSSSRVQRFPGGTPSGFWDWHKGFERSPYWDKSLHTFCPTTFLQLQAYLQSIQAQTIYVPNLVTSNLSYEVAGLQALISAQVPLGFIELGNEMFDQTVPPIAQRYPTVAAYVSQVLPYAEAFVNVTNNTIPLALCGGQDVAWNAAVAASPVAALAAGITQHVYTALPEGPYNTSAAYSGVLDQGVVAVAALAIRTAASVPPHWSVWFTEIGVFGAVYAQRTWLKGLTMARKIMLFPFIPQTSMMLPYCLVCGDPNAPGFVTPEGQYPPANCPGTGWVPTATGVAETHVFRAFDQMSNMEAVVFAALPASVVFCPLYMVGVEGAALPASGTIQPAAIECAALCSTTPGCEFWQWMISDRTCWLKSSVDGSFVGNVGSVAGPRVCTAMFQPVVGWVFSTASGGPARYLLLNVSPTASNFTIPLPPAPLATFETLTAATFADVARANTSLADGLVRTTGRVIGGALPTVMLPPYSLTTVFLN